MLSFFADDCNADGFHSLLLDGGTFNVQSGGPVSIAAANSNNRNVQAPELFLRSGDGTSPVGGSGGDILVIAGDGSGGEKIVDSFPRFSCTL